MQIYRRHFITLVLVSIIVGLTAYLIYSDLSHKPLMDSYERLKREIDQRRGVPNPCILITPNDTLVVQKVEEITGGWKDTSNLTEFWYDVREMFRWIVHNFLFNRDTFYPILPSQPWGRVQYVKDVWFFPNETLTLRTGVDNRYHYGDCEDQAILLCSMILSYEGQNLRFPTECIWIVGGNVSHMAVQISVDGNLTLLDTISVYSTSDHTGNLTSKNVSTEINKYFQYPAIDLGVNPRVYKMFSDTLSKDFASNDEYIQWMENR